MEQITKAQALSDNSMTSYMLSKKMMAVNPTHSIITELIKKASADNLTGRWRIWSESFSVRPFLFNLLEYPSVNLQMLITRPARLVWAGFSQHWQILFCWGHDPPIRVRRARLPLCGDLSRMCVRAFVRSFIAHQEDTARSMLRRDWHQPPSACLRRFHNTTDWPGINLWRGAWLGMSLEMLETNLWRRVRPRTSHEAQSRQKTTRWNLKAGLDHNQPAGHEWRTRQRSLALDLRTTKNATIQGSSSHDTRPFPLSDAITSVGHPTWGPIVRCHNQGRRSMGSTDVAAVVPTRGGVVRASQIWQDGGYDRIVVVLAPGLSTTEGGESIRQVGKQLEMPAMSLSWQRSATIGRRQGSCARKIWRRRKWPGGWKAPVRAFEQVNDQLRNDQPNKIDPGVGFHHRKRSRSSSSGGSEQQQHRSPRGSVERAGATSRSFATRLDVTVTGATGSSRREPFSSSQRHSNQRPREGSQGWHLWRTTFERAAVGVATLAVRGSDRVGAKASTVLADREKGPTAEGTRKEQTTPFIVDRSDRDLLSTMRRATRCQTGTSHDNSDKLGLDGGLRRDDNDRTRQVGRHPEATETMDDDPWHPVRAFLEHVSARWSDAGFSKTCENTRTCFGAEVAMWVALTQHQTGREMVSFVAGLETELLATVYMCALGMTDEGERSHCRTTTLMTNDSVVADAFRPCRCARDHKYVSFAGGRRSRRAQEHPRQFCELLVTALKASLLRRDRREPSQLLTLSARNDDERDEDSGLDEDEASTDNQHPTEAQIMMLDQHHRHSSHPPHIERAL